MPDIIITTANARYTHTALGIRCLMANMKELAEITSIYEFTINQRPIDIVEKLVSKQPKIIGFSVYIWNIEILTHVAKLIRQVQPDIIIILGGPEVSFKEDLPGICEDADYIIAGEGEVSFYETCYDLLNKNYLREDRFIQSKLPDLKNLELPYELYNDEDIKNRVIYVEASRGCPYGCEFCLSCLAPSVRKFPDDLFFKSLEMLWHKGVRKFKFIDRALNIGTISPHILKFFLDRVEPGLFLHFEFVPDKGLSKELFELIKAFPPGSVQFEAGVQSFNSEVSNRIGRKQDNDKVEKNLRELLSYTGVHLHADLVAGLPGESVEDFAKSFDRLFSIECHEIQVGILKRLRGAPISRHSEKWGMVYRTTAPYDILKNDLIDFKTMQRIKRFARYYDLIQNSGNFVSCSRLLYKADTPFNSFMKFSDWLFNETDQTASFALNRLAKLLFEYLTKHSGLDKIETGNMLYNDLSRRASKNIPSFLRQYIGNKPANLSLPQGNSNSSKDASKKLPQRQQRHTVE